MAERTRILFIIAQFDTGGVQFQLLLRLKHLDPARYDCRVAVLTGDGSSYLLDRVRALNVQVEFLHVEEERALWRRVGRIRDHIMRIQPDIVDTLLGWDNTYGTIAAALARVPMVVAELQNEREAVRRTTTLVDRALEAFALRLLADRIACCSNAVQESYARVFPGFVRRSMVIHDAIDAGQPSPNREEARRRFGLPLDATIVGTIGRLAPQKDHDTLLRATRELVNRHPNVIVAIGGYGPLRDALLRQRAELGLDNHVRFLGEIDDPYTLYGAVDVFAMSSRWEGFPVVVLEAMMAGRPVVSTRVGGIAEAVAQGLSGLLCAPGDSQGLAEALATLVADGDMRQRFGAESRRRVEPYTIQQLRGKWTALYESGPDCAAPRSEAPQDLRKHEQLAPLSAPALPEQASRILLWRLCPLDRLQRFIDELRRRYPGAEIDCVCQTGTATRLEQFGVHAIPYGEGRFSVFRLGVRRLVALRRRNYDLVCLPFNQPSRGGYAAAECCAAWAGRGAALGLAAWSAQLAPRDTITWARIARTRWIDSPRQLNDVLQSAGVLAKSALLARRRPLIRFNRHGRAA